MNWTNIFFQKDEITNLYMSLQLKKFYRFQESLYEMSMFAESLPQDACTGANLTTPSTPANVTDSKPHNATTPTPSEDDDDDSDDDTDKKDKVTSLEKYNWGFMQKKICLSISCMGGILKECKAVSFMLYEYKNYGMTL